MVQVTDTDRILNSLRKRAIEPVVYEMKKWEARKHASHCIKHGEHNAPRAPALAVTHPIMTCTKRQVGCRSQPLLLPASTQRHGVGGRSANRRGN